MKNIQVLLIFLLVVSCHNHALSMFYCGFSGKFCGQSTTDDVNPGAQFVILAFVNTVPDGSIIVDQANFPTQLVTKWQQSGKKVILSAGGENGNWEYVFASDNSVQNFIKSMTDAVYKFKLDGVDLDIESYLATPRTVANMIINLKKSLMSLGNKLLIVSPQDVTVYQGFSVPGTDQGGQVWNYFVPIINLADSYIDFYQPQAYNNWYDSFPGGSVDYFEDVYLNWRNFQGKVSRTPLTNFSGVKGQKLLMGVLASRKAGGAFYYANGETIKAFRALLAKNNYPLYGFMMWDSNWDKLNNYQVSNAILA